MRRWGTRTIPAASVFGSPQSHSWRVPFGTEKRGGCGYSSAEYNILDDRGGVKGGAQPMSQNGSRWDFAGHAVSLSHLDKVYWPEDGLTKGDMLAYYRDVAEVILPYFRDRPVTLRVFPEGIHGVSFYQRDAPEHAPAFLRTVGYDPSTSDEVIQLPLVDDAAGLIWLANQGAIEFHLWASRFPQYESPDMAIFDLDPGDRASFQDVLRAALLVRSALEEQGLRGFPKTSGGRGVHVYVPLEPAASFGDVRAWVKKTAEGLAARYPDQVSVAHGATHRGNRVTIDHAQNSVGKNTAAPYTLRARPGAPASAPLTWGEVEEGSIQPSDFTLRTMVARIAKEGDLFAGVLSGVQRLPA